MSENSLVERCGEGEVSGEVMLLYGFGQLDNKLKSSHTQKHRQTDGKVHLRCTQRTEPPVSSIHSLNFTDYIVRNEGVKWLIWEILTH